MRFSSDNVRKLLNINYFPYSEIKPMVFGIRGASAMNTDCDKYKAAHEIKKTDVNYKSAKCLLGIWIPVENKIALFPASTVPHVNYMKKQLNNSGRAANCIQSGYFSYYKKGKHNPSPESMHDALRLETNVFLRRSRNDLVFTNTDVVEIMNPNDNIHAAYCDTITQNYSSAGCQVIVGQPKCAKRGNKAATGYWKSFYDKIYAMPQQEFDYTLFRYVDAEAVSQAGDNLMETRLRYGSNGNVVKNLQEKLAKLGYFNTIQDGEYKKNTLEAVLKFQEDKFGKINADGVVGTGTAKELGLQLPQR